MLPFLCLIGTKGTKNLTQWDFLSLYDMYLYVDMYIWGSWTEGSAKANQQIESQTDSGKELHWPCEWGQLKKSELVEFHLIWGVSLKEFELSYSFFLRDLVTLGIKGGSDRGVGGWWRWIWGSAKANQFSWILWTKALHKRTQSRRYYTMYTLDQEHKWWIMHSLTFFTKNTEPW